MSKCLNKEAVIIIQHQSSFFLEFHSILGIMWEAADIKGEEIMIQYLTSHQQWKHGDMGWQDCQIGLQLQWDGKLQSELAVPDISISCAFTQWLPFFFFHTCFSNRTRHLWAILIFPDVVGSTENIRPDTFWTNLQFDWVWKPLWLFENFKDLILSSSLAHCT